MGLIQNIFNSLLKRKLLNNQEFLDSIEKFDKSMEELQKSLLDF